MYQQKDTAIRVLTKHEVQWTIAHWECIAAGRKVSLLEDEQMYREYGVDVAHNHEAAQRAA